MKKLHTLTKTLIKEALSKLLEVKDLSTISIKELSDYAGINRSTFYDHYETPYDVLKEITSDFLNETALKAENILKTKSMDFRLCLVEILMFIKKNKEFLDPPRCSACCLATLHRGRR